MSALVLFLPSYWPDLQRRVTAMVDAALWRDEDARDWLVPQLRGLERMARKEGGDRQTIQVIVSGRRLLGDRSVIDPTADPFAQASAHAQ